jgi:hypothetical protein
MTEQTRRTLAYCGKWALNWSFICFVGTRRWAEKSESSLLLLTTNAYNRALNFNFASGCLDGGQDNLPRRAMISWLQRAPDEGRLSAVPLDLSF